MVSYSWGLRTAGVCVAIALGGSACGGDDDDDASSGGAKAGKAGSGGRAQAGNGGRQSSGGTGGSSSGAGGVTGGSGGITSGGTTAVAGTDAGGRGGTGGAATGGAGTTGAGTTGAGTTGAGTTGAGTGGGGLGGGGLGGAGGASGEGGAGGEGGDAAGASGAGGSPEPVCGDNTVDGGEDCDGGNTDDLDGCNSKCQSEPASGPGLLLAIADNGYTGTLGSMVCVDLAVVTKGDGMVDSVKVLVGITHTFAGDLVLKLKSPSGTVVTLMSRPGVVEPADDGQSSGGDSSNLASSSRITFRDGGPKTAENLGNSIADGQTVCLNDAACVYAPSAGSATAGILSAFNSEAAAGTWSFCAGDGLTGDTGSIDFVRLSVAQ